jgi:hypothetical protein
MKCNYQFVVCFLCCLSSFVIKAQDLDTIQTDNFKFAPSIAGGQLEFTTLLIVNELGALMDIDLFKMKSRINYSFGTRISFEHYYYIEFAHPSSGPFNDYCFYLMHSGRSESFHFNIFVGLAYHTEPSTNFQSETLFRAGFEAKFNVAEKIFGIIFKGSSSFDANTTYFGIGIAAGYYE